MSYSLVLQTISTLTAVIGVSAAIFFGVRGLQRQTDELKAALHEAVGQQTTHLKNSIEQQTRDLKS